MSGFAGLFPSKNWKREETILKGCLGSLKRESVGHVVGLVVFIACQSEKTLSVGLGK